MYAILDIETTGGQYNEEGITEIAIYKFDGEKVVDQFISLINPEKEIQPFVVNLTGINNKMLERAPKFYEVAKRIVEITEDCIIVAHNANFDYRILRTEFNRLGFEYKRKTLCTVDLAEELMPEQESYSLGKLTKALGIPVSDRHRANGDAMATVQLFKMILAKDTEKNIVKNTVISEPKYQLQPNLIEIVEELPTVIGVYYMHDTHGNIIYIGKGKNIKQRVNHHFTSSRSRSKKMRMHVSAVTFEATGTELIAKLKEHEERQRNKPTFNKSSKKLKITHGIYQSEDENGFIHLSIDALREEETAITTFSSVQNARQFLLKAIQNYGISFKYVDFGNKDYQRSKSFIKLRNKHPEPHDSIEIHNEKVSRMIAENAIYDQNMALVGKGRNVGEKSVVLIEDGAYKGFGFTRLNHQINNLDILRNIVTPMENGVETQHIIDQSLRRSNNLKKIHLNANPINE